MLMDEFINLKEDYSNKKDNFIGMYENTKSKVVHSKLTKGFPENIFPFEFEMLGKGKIKSEEIECVPIKTMSDNYYYTHYNENQQIIMSEQWSFGKFRHISIYIYNNDYIKKYLWTIPMPEDIGYKLLSISLLELENQKAVKRYDFTPLASTCSVSTYQYENNTLLEISTKYSTYIEKYNFGYNNKELQTIIRTFSNDKLVQQIFPKVKMIK